LAHNNRLNCELKQIELEYTGSFIECKTPSIYNRPVRRTYEVRVTLFILNIIKYDFAKQAYI